MSQVTQRMTFPPVSGPWVWNAEQLSNSGDWLVELSEAHRREIAQAVAEVEARGLDFFDVRAATFPLPTLGPLLEKSRVELLHGRGFVQFRGFPVDQDDLRRSALGYWGLSSHLGDAFLSQNAKGHVLGHVLDTGESRSNPDQRGPYSSEALPFHVDCCDIVGLLCMGRALLGGESTVASSGHLHNRLLETRPELIAPLFEPYYRDRRGEVPPGTDPWYAIPIFNWHEGILSTTVEPTYIGSVARHFEGRDPHTPQQIQALLALQDMAHEEAFALPFEVGDIQFLNNHTVMHSRRSFQDGLGRTERRHLVRLWLQNLDGRPLPQAYYERHGSPDDVIRPGGIIGKDTMLNCPLEVEL